MNSGDLSKLPPSESFSWNKRKHILSTHFHAAHMGLRLITKP